MIDQETAANPTYDLIVLGGGIHGVCMTLEASRRGLRTLLLERETFGGATSANSLRMIHGGFRYLQTLNLGRLRESVNEQRWFLKQFPDLVQPLACLMPLYGQGLRRPWTFGMALKVYDWLSRHGDADPPLDRPLPAGRVIDAEQTRQLFPGVDQAGLRGGGLWHDVIMTHSQRLLIELLRWARACGATALDQTPANQLRVEQSRVVGVEAGGQVYRAPVIVNCAGPWCRELARQFDRDIPKLMRPSMAFNLLLDHTPVSEMAVAVAPKKPNARTYFLVPWQGAIFAGTYHAPWKGSIDQPAPTDQQVQDFLDDLNAAVPSIEATRKQIIHTYCGIIPAVRDHSDKTASASVFIDHAAHDGPQGLFSMSGVKYTTARRVAETLMKRIFGHRPYQPNTERPTATDAPDDFTIHPGETALAGITTRTK